MFKKLRGFTMAEAILVMTILGIIATIMISTLKPAEYKEKSMQIMAKKVLSELDVATTQIIMNDTVDGTLDAVIEAGTGAVMTNVRLTEGSDKMLELYKKYLTAIRKAPNTTIPLASAMLLKDGASIHVIFQQRGTSTANTIFPGETEETANTQATHGIIFFDINDDDGPNVAGKDQFTLPLYKYGIQYAE